MKNKKRTAFMEAIKREKTRNYIILYMVTLVIWLILLIYSFVKGFFTGEEFIVNVVNNIIGILPPILIFDFFNERLSREATAAEMSDKITETLMSRPETLNSFTLEQRRNFIKSTIESIAEDEDAADMINGSLKDYLFNDNNYRIRTAFDYSFELDSSLPFIYNEIFGQAEDYFYVQEKLHYTVKYLSPEANNMTSNIVKVGFLFDNKSLDSALREKKNAELFDKCIFREILDIKPEDLENLKNIVSSKEMFMRLFKLDIQVDRFHGILEDVIVCNEGIVCLFNIGHDRNADIHSIRIIFHMPKLWNSILEVALVDPVKAPGISLSYPDDTMNVEMFSFLSKGEESSLEVAHEHLNGIYDIAISSEWIYPISGIVFSVKKNGKYAESFVHTEAIESKV